MDPNDINEKELNKQEKDTNRKMAKIKGKITGTIFSSFVQLAIIPMLKIFFLIAGISLLFEGVQYLLEGIRADNVKERTLEVLEVDDLEGLVEIKGNPDTGYYIGYVDGFDQKLEELSERLKDEHNLPSTETDTVEKMIRAQLITQFPNLGGEVGGKDDGKEKVGLSTDEEGTSSFSSLDGFLFIGDSITNGLGASGNISNATFKGSDNSTPEQWLNNKISTNGQPTYSILPDDSDDITALCVMLGANNLGQASEMKQLLEKLHEKYPEKTIFVQKIWVWRDDNINAVNKYNSEIESFCNSHDYCVFIDTTENVEKRAENDVHPSSEGYKQFAKNIEKAITSSSVQSPSTEESEESEEEETEQEREEDLEPSQYEGFQGSVKIRRVTPDKERGELKDTGSGVISIKDNSNLQAGTALETEVKKYIDESGASGTWSVYAKNLDTDQVEVNISNEKMESASLIKLFIMATAFDEIEKGNINLEEISADLEIMITESDNEATNRIIDKIGFDTINAYIKTNKYSDTEINRKMLEEDTEGDNYTSVSDVARLLENIYEGTCVNSSSSEKMLEFLKKQKRTSKIPAGVPDNVETANKTGELDDVENDAAIVFKENTPYILVVMSEKLTNTNKARNTIKKISSIVYKGIGGKDSNEKHIIAIDAGHGDSKYAGNYDELATSQEDLDNGKKYYTSGTSGKAVDGSIWKEAEAVQKVVDKVMEIMKQQYPSIQVVQTGRDQPNFKRIDLAKSAGAEAYIGVHLNSSDDDAGNGSEVYIRPGDGNDESKEFGEYIVDAVDNALNIKNNGVNDKLEENTRGLKTYEECGIPNIYIEGAYMNSSDMKVIGSEEGLQKYAQGIVDGIAKYFGLKDESDYEEIGITKETTSVSSRIYDMYFVPTDTFNKYVSENDERALESFTLDTSGKLITAKWSYSDSEGLKIIKNSPINFRTVLSKYVTTYEYLMDYWIDIKEEDFILAFANKVLESEFIITIEDNVTTIDTTIQTIVSTSQGESSSSSATTFSETVSNEIELSYVDTWFVKFSKDYDFSDVTISSANAGGTAFTGSQGEKIGDFTVTGYCPCSECSGEKENDEDNKDEKKIEFQEGVTVASNNLEIGEYIMFNNHIYRVDDTGDGVTNNTINIYFDSHEEVLEWGTQHYPVFFAEDVTETTSEVTGDSILLAIASIPGKVTENKADTTNSVLQTLEDGTPATMTTITNTHTISNKYDTGESNVSSKEEEFIELFESFPEAKSRVKPRWLVRIVKKNAAHMTDITKYLMNVLFEEEVFDEIDKDKIYEQYKDNSFKSATGGLYGGTIHEKVWWALIDAGYSKIAAAGAMGNIEAESRFSIK